MTLPRSTERSKSSPLYVWEKRGAIRQGYRLTRVPVRDQFNRIPRDRTSSMNHPLPAEPRNVKCTRASGSLSARSTRTRKSLRNSCTVTLRRLSFVVFLSVGCAPAVHIPLQILFLFSFVKISSIINVSLISIR